MKKNYVKPTLEVVMFSPESMLAGSIIEGGDKPAWGGQMSKKYQGGWRHEEWTKIN